MIEELQADEEFDKNQLSESMYKLELEKEMMEQINNLKKQCIFNNQY
jgi:hypothetical protein